MTPDDVDAAVLDLDGVVTDTASVHAAAWKRLFDEFLRARAERDGDRFQPFERADYLEFVDGKPREDGVRSFLASRGIDLNGDGDGDGESVASLAARKDRYFHEQLRTHGVRRFTSTVDWLGRLRARGVRTAVVSASRNARAVLRAAGVEDLFDVRVDGEEAARLGLPGKPDPAMFVEAARRLGVEPARCLVVEDALAGVQAGARGGFGLVVGVDRSGRADQLRAAGADLVVGDLAELAPKAAPRAPAPEALPAGRRPARAWMLAYDGFDPDEEKLREALCTLGNGYFATRGAAPESAADDVHYPGTYLAGCYNRLVSEVEGQQVGNEDLVNLPNWLPLRFRVVDGDGGGEWFAPERAELLHHQQELDLRQGVLTRLLRWRDQAGNVTRVAQRRLVSMADPHVAALETTFVAENWSGRLQVAAELDGRVVNAGVERYKRLDGRHLTNVATGAVGDETVWLEAETSQSRVRVDLAARTRVMGAGAGSERATVQQEGLVGHRLDLVLERQRQVTVEKVVTLFNSRDRGPSESRLAAIEHLDEVGGFDELLDRHVLAWSHLWRKCAIRVDDGAGIAPILNLHLFHLLQTASPHTVDLDVGVPARGLHGEAYRGHIFWDELFILPLLNLRLPQVSRGLLRYRWRRLPAARRNARAAGYEGAMYPWQSGSDGREETQTLHLNPRSGRWLPDRSQRQRHVNIAIAYNLWHYVEVTGDMEFLSLHGAEMLVEIARFWASIASYDRSLGRWRIRGVMGPDEYHDGYPDADEGGLDDNAYTNVMAVWVLCRALDALRMLPEDRRTELVERLGLRREEIDRWEAVSRGMRVVFHADGVISQFDGFERLEEFDWQGYRDRYGDIQRLDRILEAEDDSTNRYRLSKQADVLMLFYLLSAEELGGLLRRLGYEPAPDMIQRTIEYYLARTSHGSTLSGMVHSWVLARSDRAKSWRFLERALVSDLRDTQGGTTREGIHLGAMAGTVDMIQRGYTGLEVRGDVLWLNPLLPDELRSLEFDVRYRGHGGVRIRAEHGRLEVSLRRSAGAPIQVGHRDRIVRIEPGVTWSTAL
jgi:beta-phosphoglucomutase family hydrolase